MQGVCEINSQCCPFESFCHLHRIFQSHSAQPGKPFQCLIYFCRRNSVQALQHPGCFKKDGLGNPHQPARQKGSGARCLGRIISRQKTDDDVSICRDHGVSSLPSQWPRPSQLNSCASLCISGTRKHGLWLFLERAAAFSEKPLRPAPPRPIRFRSPIFVIPAATLAVPPALSTIFLLFSSRYLMKSKTNVRRIEQYTQCTRQCPECLSILHIASPRLVPKLWAQ